MVARIFVVEDDNSLRLLYEKALNFSGHHVIATAKNGQEAVAMFINFTEKPDVILMDHRMPIKNGIEASKEIMENSSIEKPKIIFVSADQTVKEEAISIGVQSFKEKPFTLNNLFSNIEKALKESNL